MDDKLKRIFYIASQRNASDVHIVPVKYPTLRIDGELINLNEEGIISSRESKELLFSMLNEDQKNYLLKYKDIDFSFNIDDKIRVRANIYFQNNGLAGAFRLIPTDIKTIEELNLPPILHEFIKKRQGLILITGPAGVGKSTTLAALIDEINHTKPVHIITIEEPIEYIFLPDLALISQREIPRDSPTWHRALRAALREDPDIIMIGELRDAISIQIALTAAETGHLVLGTLHTNSASQTIDRILDVLPEAQKNQARFQLASTLIGIISQRLVNRTKGGRIPACEVLIANPAVKNLIRENKVYQIDLVIETSLESGMFTLERSLATLVNLGEITLENAFNYSINPERLKNLLK
ncbi:MAG: PilT/PilU family type 4a pilus ATPase [Patescibacteria group bacterium]|nr:PilT/PilU family type 4a pilus ATPase [Patescibacteria group bacterium]